MVKLLYSFNVYQALTLRKFQFSLASLQKLPKKQFQPRNSIYRLVVEKERGLLTKNSWKMLQHYQV